MVPTEALKLLVCCDDERAQEIVRREIEQSGLRRGVVVRFAANAQEQVLAELSGACSDAVVVVCGPEHGIDEVARGRIFLASQLGARNLLLAIAGATQGELGPERLRMLTASFWFAAGPLQFPNAALIPIPHDGAEADTPSLPRLLESMQRLDRHGPFRMMLTEPTSVRQPPSVTGTVVGGSIRPGDIVVAARTGQTAHVSAISANDQRLNEATAGSPPLTLILDAACNAATGDIIAAAASRPEVVDQFAAMLIWMGDEPMLPGRRYQLNMGTRTVLASITDLKHVVDMADFGRIPAKSLQKGDIGLCNFATTQPIAIDAFEDSPATGSFTLLNREQSRTMGAGLIQFALRRATNIQIQRIEIDKAARAALKGQRPAVLWFTGLSGAGKTTIANLVEQRLVAQGRHTYLLDGDNLRHGLNKDLGFLPADRVENMRRVGEVAKLMVDAGLIVLVSLISPFRSERQMVRELFAPGEFLEIHVDASLDTCRRRDPKGLYKKAEEGKIANFTGISSPYEPPQAPDIRLSSDEAAPEELAEQVLEHLRAWASHAH